MTSNYLKMRIRFDAFYMFSLSGFAACAIIDSGWLHEGGAFSDLCRIVIVFLVLSMAMQLRWLISPERPMQVILKSLEKEKSSCS